MNVEKLGNISSGAVAQSRFGVNPGLQFNSLFQFVHFNASISFKTLEDDLDSSNLSNKLYTFYIVIVS